MKQGLFLHQSPRIQYPIKNLVYKETYKQIPFRRNCIKNNTQWNLACKIVLYINFWPLIICCTLIIRSCFYLGYHRLSYKIFILIKLKFETQYALHVVFIIFTKGNNFILLLDLKKNFSCCSSHISVTLTKPICFVPTNVLYKGYIDYRLHRGIWVLFV